MGYLRNNSVFTFGKADRARTSANFREILDAMWLFNSKFEKARTKYVEIKARSKSPDPKPPASSTDGWRKCFRNSSDKGNSAE